MLVLENVWKAYHTRAGVKQVLQGVNMVVHPGDAVGILGRNGAGKSTLLRIFAGVEMPTVGRVWKDMSVSWPLASGIGVQSSLTGADNARFIARIYDLDYRVTRQFVDDFAELGSQLAEPVKTYSSGMRARLAFALSIAIEFDCYLIDEVIMVGDQRFFRRCQEELFEKRSDRALIIVSHDMGFIRQVCDRGSVIHDSRLHLCGSVDEGVEFYTSL